MSTAESPTPRDALATLRIPRREEPRRPSFVRRILRWLLVIGILAALGWGGFFLAQRTGWVGDGAEWIPAAIRSLPEVRVSRVVVERGRAADALVVATGYLESRRQAMIGARAAGRIEVVTVEEGSQVAGGEIIAILEHKDMDAALAATKAELARARAAVAEQAIEIARTKSDFERARKLRETRSIATEEFDQARFLYQGAIARRDSLSAAVMLAKARVQQAEQLNENMIIRAPFDGTVISKNAEVGESILPGGMGEASGRGSVVTIADLDHLEVDCDVKEDYISRVTEGAPTEVAVDAVPDRRYEGRVRKIIPMGDRARATIKVKVEIVDADHRLFPDMSSTVYFLPVGDAEPADHEKRRVFCDSQAIRQVEDRYFVWLLTDKNRGQRVDVTIAEQGDDRTEIVSGLTLTSLSRKSRDEHVRAALEVVGVTDRMDHYPRQLSGGQEQRVSIARAIATDPTLIVADEPTGDLDAKSAGEILDLMARLNQEFEKTIVMVTHDPHAAERAARLLHLEKGVLVDDVTPLAPQEESA